MLTNHIYERLTHKYVDGWRELDREKFVATVQSTPPRLVREGNGHDDMGSYIMHVRAPRDAPDLRQGLRDTFSGSNCRHEYDCCGCTTRRAAVNKVSARDYVLRVSVSRNY